LVISFLIRQLGPGGAERQLVLLAKGLAKRGHQIQIIRFYSGGELESELDGSNVCLLDLGKQGRWDNIKPLMKLIAFVRKRHPDILHGYLPLTNLMCLLVKPFSNAPKIVWGVRGSFTGNHGYGLLRALIFVLERWCSHFPDLIITNSIQGKKVAIQSGFPISKLTVIANSIDTDRFRPDADMRHRQRKIWKLDKQTPIIGIIARFDPVKDHTNFLRAARIAYQKNRSLRFIIVGDANESARQQLIKKIHELQLEHAVILEGFRTDVETIYQAIDLACLSSSHGEGFPNILGEAMACGVPCVSTMVGDAEHVIGETGLVVPVKSPELLSAAWLIMIERISCEPEISKKIRERIVNNYSYSSMLETSEKVLENLVIDQ